MLEGSRRTGRIEPLLTAAPYAALGVYALVCVLWWVEADWRPDWDSAIYILAARSLADGEGYSYLGRPFVLRPPGLSWLISIALPAEGFDAAALNHGVMAFAATAVAAVYFALVRPYGRWMAVGVALLAGTSQLVVARFNWVLSEFPFVTLVFLAVGLFQLSAADGARGWLASLAAGACAAGAFYVRSVAVLLLPGMLLVGLVGRRGGQRWRAGLSVALATALCVPWLWHVRAAAEDAEVPSQQLLLSDYATAMFRVDPGDPYSARLSFSDWRVRVERNGTGLLSDLSRAVLSRDDTSLGWVLLLPVAAGLIEQLGLALDSRGNIAADVKRFGTSEPGVFAAGDCRRGQSLVVWAQWEGREAARAVDQYLVGHSRLQSRDATV